MSDFVFTCTSHGTVAACSAVIYMLYTEYSDSILNTTLPKNMRIFERGFIFSLLSISNLCLSVLLAGFTALLSPSIALLSKRRWGRRGECMDPMEAVLPSKAQSRAVR